MTMKRASQLSSLFQLGLIAGVFIYLYHSLVHPLGPFYLNISLGLMVVSIIGYYFTYRKTRHGRLAALERCRRRNKVTSEEYTEKRQEILKDI